MKVGDGIDVYEVLPNTRYVNMKIGRVYPAEIHGNCSYVGLPDEKLWVPSRTLHAFEQIGHIAQECKKVGTLIIKSIKKK